MKKYIQLYNIQLYITLFALLAIVLNTCISSNNKNPHHSPSSEHSITTIQLSKDTLNHPKPQISQITNEHAVHQHITAPTSVSTSDYPFCPNYQITQTIAEQIQPPRQFSKTPVEPNSYAEWLRYLPLYPPNRNVYDYQGNVIKTFDQVVRVIHIDNPSHGMQQCADIAIRLHAEYLRSINELDNLRLHTQNGQLSTWNQWKQGYRPRLQSDQFVWIPSVNATRPETLDQDFTSYLTWLMQWTGTLALARDLPEVQNAVLEIGDMYVNPNQSGSNIGHITLIVDRAYSNIYNSYVYLIAWSFIPAQDFHILYPFATTQYNYWFQKEEIEEQLSQIFAPGKWIRFE